MLLLHFCTFEEAALKPNVPQAWTIDSPVATIDPKGRNQGKPAAKARLGFAKHEGKLLRAHCERLLIDCSCQKLNQHVRQHANNTRNHV